MDELNNNERPTNDKIEKIKKFVKENKKLVTIVGGIILLIIIVAISISIFSNKNGAANKNKVVANTNSGIVENEEYKNLKFSNATLVKENNQYTLTMDVKNDNKENFTDKQVDIILKDKKGKTIITLLGYIGDNLKPGETRTITASISADVDLSKATDKEIVEHK